LSRQRQQGQLRHRHQVFQSDRLRRWDRRDRQVRLNRQRRQDLLRHRRRVFR
jgi:hypothetical protein